MDWWMILIIVYSASAFIMYAIYMPSRMRYIRRRRLGQPTTYAEKMSELTSQLLEASQAVDQVLTEMAEANQRQGIILSQQAERADVLSAREKQLQQRIESLQEVPLPVADYFIELNRKAQEEQDKKRAWRDYKLIIISTVLSAALTIAIMALFG